MVKRPVLDTLSEKPEACFAQEGFVLDYESWWFKRCNQLCGVTRYDTALLICFCDGKRNL